MKMFTKADIIQLGDKNAVIRVLVNAHNEGLMTWNEALTQMVGRLHDNCENLALLVLRTEDEAADFRPPPNQEPKRSRTRKPS